MRLWFKHWFVISAYTAIAISMTWPVVLHFGTAIPGVEGDAASYLWALGWAKTALADLHVNPFRTDFVFYPLGGATQLLWAVSLIGLVSIPLQFLLGLIATYNLLYLAATVLTAYGTFLLAEHVMQPGASSRQSAFDPRPLPPFATFMVTQYLLSGQGAGRYARIRHLASRCLPAFAAGIVFAFAPLRFGYGLSFFNLFNTEFVPFYALFLMLALREPSRRATILAGLLLALNVYVDFQIAAFLILYTGVYAGYTVFVADPHSHSLSLVGRGQKAFKALTLIGLVSVVVVAPMLALVASDFAVEGGNYIRVFKLDFSAARSYDLASFFVPHASSTLYADSPLKVAGVNSGVKVGDESALSPDRQAFIGYVTLALAAYAAVRQWRRSRFWLFAAIAFAVISLGPTLHVLGRDTGVPLPYLLLHEIPILNHIRIPMRFGIAVFFAVALLVAIGLRDLQLTLGKRNWLVRLLPLAILVEYAVLPYPVQSIPLPRVYAEIARVPGDFTVLEIPTFNWRGAAATEVYQAIHQKRILRAYTNRTAPGLAEYFGTRGTPIVVRTLRVLEGAEAGGLAPEDIAEDRRARDQVFQFFDLRYAVVHRQFMKPEETRAVEAYMRDVLNARVIYDDGETVGYEMPRAPKAAGSTNIDLRENSGQMYAGRGWQFEYPQANWRGQFNFVWARGARSEIYFVGNGQESTLILHAYADPPQGVSVWLNDVHVGDIELKSEWKDYRITLPAGAVLAGMNRVQLIYEADLEETIGVTTVNVE